MLIAVELHLFSRAVSKVLLNVCVLAPPREMVEVVILIGTGVIAIFFWALLILIFCNVKRVSVTPVGTRGHVEWA